MEHQPKLTIYYDGVCNLCSGLVEKINASLDGDRFAPTPVSAKCLPRGVTEKEALRDVHVVDETGRIYKGADAVLKILEQYPRLQFLAALGRLPLLHAFARVLYRIIEKTRYRIFGRKDTGKTNNT